MKFTKYATGGDYHWQAYARGGKYKRHADRVKKWVKETNVLDIGAGDGCITKLLNIEGIEYEESAVRLARKHGSNVIQGDAYFLPYPAETFDSALMIDVLEHFDWPEEAIRVARRVIKKYLYICTPPKKDNGTLTDRFHVQEWSPEGLWKLVESQGFKLKGGITVYPNEKTMYAKFKKV